MDRLIREAIGLEIHLYTCTPTQRKQRRWPEPKQIVETASTQN